jgi:microsomal dipeptidase-like Zn-dependent dipeptidase
LACRTPSISAVQADVDFFHALGQRVSQLTYNSRNLIGNGSTERRDEGISDFGVAIIEPDEQGGHGHRRVALRRSHHA